MRYQDDLDAMPRRLRLKEGAPRSTLEQRVTMLERRVSELSATLNGITNQLVDVSSSVHDMTHLPGVYGQDELSSDAEPVDEPPHFANNGDEKRPLTSSRTTIILRKRNGALGTT